MLCPRGQLTYWQGVYPLTNPALIAPTVSLPVTFAGVGKVAAHEMSTIAPVCYVA